MWKQETYRAISEEFATAVGVATAITVTDIKTDPDIVAAAGRDRFRHVTDQIRINRIVAEAVRIGKYREVTRRSFWLQRRNPNWPERRVWSSAWREVAGRPLPKLRSVKT